MGKRHSGYRTISFKYALGEPENWSAVCDREIHLQIRLWNALADIDRTHKAQHIALLATDPDVEGLRRGLERLTLKRKHLERQLEGERSSRRGLHDRSAAEVLRRCRLESTQLQAALRRAIRRAACRLRPQMEQLERCRRKLSRIARSTSGLWWCNSDATSASYARNRANLSGTGGEFRRRRFVGEGRLTCHINRGATWQKVQSGRCACVSAEPLEPSSWSAPRRQRGRATRTRLSVTVRMDSRERTWVTFPMQMHRPIPGDAKIVRVIITRDRIVDRWKYHAIFAVRVPAPATPSRDAPGCGINLGLRKTGIGLRVATAATQGGWQHLHLPLVWLDKWRRLDEIRVRRTRALHQTCRLLRSTLSRMLLAEPVEAIAAELGRSLQRPVPSAYVLRSSVERWRNEFANYFADALAEAELWRRIDKRLHHEEVHLRAKLVAQRRELYRLWACCVAADHGKVVVRRLEPDSTAARCWREPDAVRAAVTRKRSRTAFYEVVHELFHQCMKHGTQFLLCSGPVTQTCSVCGGRSLREADVLIQTCSNCGSTHDPDENAASNLLWAGRLNPKMTGFTIRFSPGSMGRSDLQHASSAAS